jgi:hypothetical protein
MVTNPELHREFTLAIAAARSGWKTISGCSGEPHEGG